MLTEKKKDREKYLEKYGANPKTNREEERQADMGLFLTIIKVLW